MDVLDYLNSLGGVDRARGGLSSASSSAASGASTITASATVTSASLHDRDEHRVAQDNRLRAVQAPGLGKDRRHRYDGATCPPRCSPERAASAAASTPATTPRPWTSGRWVLCSTSSSRGDYPGEDVSQPGNITATLRRVREGRMNKLPSNLSASVCDLLTCMIRVNPARRAKLAEISAPRPSPGRPWVRRASRARSRCRWRIVGWRAPDGVAPINVGGACGPRRGRDASTSDAPEVARRAGQLSRSALRRWRLDRFHLRRTHHVKILWVLPPRRWAERRGNE